MAEEQGERVGCLGALLGIFGGDSGQSESGGEDLPYRLRDDFLSPAERSFHTALSAAVGQGLAICPKVNLADLFFVARPNEDKGARGRISQKHVDFLLCEPASMRPRLGIELDDSSHQRADRQARDEFVDRVFLSAGLPLLHVPASASYSVPQLSSLVLAGIGDAPIAPVAVSAPSGQPAGVAPVCPKCGIPMVLRTPSKGGDQFWGCANYPRCRQTAPR